MKVVIFCGGLGLRMGESSAPSIPKPMVPLGHQPLLWHIMKYYSYWGHKDFILCLGNRAEVIKDYFLNYNEAMSNDFVLSEGGKQVELLRSDIQDWRITFVNTGLHTNIGQRLKSVRKLIGDDEIFLAAYGDDLTDAPLPDMISTFRAQGKKACFLCVKPTSYSFHTVAVNDSGLVRQIQHITESDILINGGFFVFHRDIFDHIRDGEDLIEEPFERLIALDQVLAYRYDGFWAPMDTLKDKHNLEAMIENGNPPWQLWEATDGGALPAVQPYGLVSDGSSSPSYLPAVVGGNGRTAA